MSYPHSSSTAPRGDTRRRDEGRLDLGDGCWLRHDPRWLASVDADALLDQLHTQLQWEQRAIVLFGREVMQPRLVAWAGDLPYRYSGKTLPPKPPPPPLELVMRQVSEATGEAFNHVLANRYRDGRDSMGMHSDDEPELGLDPTVASLSLGAPRRFVFVTKAAPKRRRAIVLEHGSLLVICLLYTSPSPRDGLLSRMPSSA